MSCELGTREIVILYTYKVKVSQSQGGHQFEAAGKDKLSLEKSLML